MPFGIVAFINASIIIGCILVVSFHRENDTEIERERDRESERQGDRQARQRDRERDRECVCVCVTTPESALQGERKFCCVALLKILQESCRVVMNHTYLTQRSYGMMGEASVGHRGVPAETACDIFLIAVHGTYSLTTSATGLGQDTTKVDIIPDDRLQQ